MELLEHLAGLGIPRAAIERIGALTGGRLYPLQRQALEQTALLHPGEDLLVSAPTASGKTLLAELAALATLARARLVLYLVPTRALAEEKAAEFAARYGPAGIRVACSTRDRRASDAAILDGAVSITVAVYEKALALLGARPGLLGRFGLVVADEIQLVGDAGRGAAVDLFLTRWRRAARRPHLLALSAVLGNPEELAGWLGVRLLRSEQRPVPLREGVLDLSSGVYRWREAHSGERGNETLPIPAADGAEPEHHGVAAAAAVARHLGPVILFCATRREALRTAFDLAENHPAAPAEEALEELRAAEHDLSRERLETLLAAGIGLHTADMPAAQRALVERAFGAGALALLVATPTLEQGVNLSAAAVIQKPLMVDEVAGGAGPAVVPISRARFVNQGGRAGRGGDAVGRSLVFAENAFAAEQCWRAFITAPLEPVASPLGGEALTGEVAVLLAAGEARTRGELAALFAETLGARRLGVAAMEQRLGRDIGDGLRDALWLEDASGRLTLTALGEALARTALAAATVVRWRPLLAGLERAECRPALLFTLMLAEEWERFPLCVDAASRRRNQWPTGLRRRLDGRDELAVRLGALFAAQGGAPYAFHRAARRALLLDDWLAGESIAELELLHGLASGQMARLASDGAWLAGAAADVAGVLGCAEDVVEAWEQLAGKLAALARPLAASLAGGQARGESTFAPGAGGLTEPCGPEEPGAPLAGARLRFPAADPGVVEWGAARVELAPIPYDLLLLLARRAGSVVSYSEIHATIWHDSQVQQQMVPYHRGRIEKSLGLAPGELIETRFKRGLRLRLGPEDVEIEAGVEEEAG